MRRVTLQPNPALFVICLVILSGCARTPWQKPVSEDRFKEVNALVQGLRDQQENCPATLDAEVTVNWQNSVSKQAYNGYLQLLQPDSVKLIVPNPLGQPIMLMAATGGNYQLLDPLRKEHHRGKIKSLLLRYGLPLELALHSQWGAWLTGRMAGGELEISTVRSDRDGNGVWVSFDRQEKGLYYSSHLLIDPKGPQLQRRVIESDREGIVADINYEGGRNDGSICQTDRLTITSLPYNGRLDLSFGDQLTNKPLGKDDFSLSVPKGYLTKLRP
ncbi:MAG: hypothetical protein ABFS19_10565 [Thermodesulfobacteriota bacterium]